jgi:UDP-N-acetylglucosamine 2-epimerase (hydrolysing)
MLSKNKRRIVFLTGTRADFGKMKSLIEKTIKLDGFEIHIFVTGMHLQKKYGFTVEEIEKHGYGNIYRYINHTSEKSMDQTLSKTVDGFSSYIQETLPDLIVIHGDRVEALAGAIVGALNNILVAHIEGGEVSGTIDELIRHSVSKLSHTHFVSNQLAKNRLIQMGEIDENIFIIGSPDVDIMISDKLPSLVDAKKRYEVTYDEYAIVLFHPVTTEQHFTKRYAKNLVEALIQSQKKYIVIYPNNDLGSSDILEEYEKLEGLENFRLFPSLRFEHFLVLLKNAAFIIGNSSAGIREAPYYGLATINIGTRQQNRALHKEIIECGHSTEEILEAIKIVPEIRFDSINLFGEGTSDKLFADVLNSKEFWEISKQKLFKDIISQHEKTTIDR